MNPKSLFTAAVFAVGSCAPVYSQQEIKVGKALQISIKGVPAEEQAKIDGQYSVKENGYIEMPHIGSVRAAGLRAGDLASNIQSAYRTQGIYRTPTIQVFSNAEGSGVDKPVVTIGGYVRAPGPKEFTQGLTLWQAIQAAGGANEFGSVKRVTLFRNGSGKRYDVSQPQFMSIPLEPGDTIEIPQKTILGQ